MNREPVKSYTPPRLLLIACLGLTFAPMLAGCGGDKASDSGQPIPDTEDDTGPSPEIEVEPPPSTSVRWIQAP